MRGKKERRPGQGAPLGRTSADGESTNAEATAVNFLKQLRPGGPSVLTAIAPMTNAIETITAQNENEVRQFVRRWNGKCNIYYSVNPTRGAMTSKAAKVDIAKVEYLLADLDPNDDERPEAAKTRYLKALETFKPAPTAIIDSGNGVQVLWRLTDSIDLAKYEPVLVTNAKTGKLERQLSPEAAVVVANVESRVEALMLHLGSKAGTQNVDRILRVPGTTNLPNKKKTKAGRVSCVSRLVRFNGATCTLEQFPAAKPRIDTYQAAKPNSNRSKVDADTDVDALPISARMKNLIRGIDDPEHPYDSKSERVIAVLKAMAGAGCDDVTMREIMLDPSLPISEHVRDQKKPEKYLTRQIDRARQFATDPDVAKLNQEYAVVRVGDKVTILRQGISPEGRADISLLTVGAFQQWFANKFVRRKGMKKQVSLGTYWFRHPQRRQYDGLVFAPGREVQRYFNLWRGFAVERLPGDCSRFLAHIRDNVCQGDKDLFAWVIGWFAYIFQNPETKNETCLVIRGEEGTGKTKLGDVIGSLLGEHYLAVSDPRYITGRFNSHMVYCLLLHAEEAFWAGDHAAESRLKDLVTGKYHLIEFKGKEPIRVGNFVRLFITGNPEWVVPVSLKGRRFAVLEMGEAHKKDAVYFAAIDEEMDHGGREALLHHLLNFDLSSVNLREVPKTAALLEQKHASLTIEQGWWLDILHNGRLPYGGDVAGQTPTSLLFDHYVEKANKIGVRRRAIETKLGMFLNRFVPDLRKREATYKNRANMDEVGSIYEFPPLSECRKAFEKIIEQPEAWDDDPVEWFLDNKF